MADKLEILAPAGSYEAFLAAVAAGADAVYLGGKNFGARAYAANFKLEDMAALFRYAHLRDVKVYVTVNTLVTDAEMPEAVQYVKNLYELGADAVIIQDLGLLQVLSKQLPDLPLNASTQMVIHNSLGAKMAAKLGFKRVILARETPLATMKAIKEAAAIETEVFVHGALCVCYSGQCLFSSLVGGRSGNRGRCAQPCRLYYSLLDETGQKIAANHLLSPKDLKALTLLSEIKAAGVTSAKIEGRMKRPEYVAAVTGVYADGQASPENEAKLLASFNREFTSGYLLKNQGAGLMSYNRPNNRGTKLGRIVAVDYEKNRLTVKLEAPLNLGDGLEIWVTKGGRQGFTVETILWNRQSVTAAAAKAEVVLPCPSLSKEIQHVKAGDRLFKNHDSKLAADAKAVYEAQALLPISMAFKAHLNEAPVLIVTNGKGQTGMATADYVVPLAQKHPADRAGIEKQLNRLGGTGYKLTKLDLAFDEGIMLPASVLNNLRRAAVADLEAKALTKWQRPQLKINLPDLAASKAKTTTKIAVQVDDLASALAAQSNGAAMIYLGNTWQAKPEFTAAGLEKLARNHGEVYYILPAIAGENEIAGLKNKLLEFAQTPLSGVVVGNLWALELVRELGLKQKIVSDFNFNIFNSQALAFCREQGIARAGLSLELNWRQIENLCPVTALETLAYGNLPLMVSEHCPVGALAGGRTASQACRKVCLQGHKYKLKDEKGFEFPIEMDKSCRLHLFNGYQLCMLEDLKRFLNNNIEVIRLDLRRHHAKQVAAITSVFAQALSACQNDLEPDYRALKAELSEFAIAPFTKGHYYRGVE